MSVTELTARPTSKITYHLDGDLGLRLASDRRDLALSNLAVDSKLRGSDLVKMKVSDISNAGVVSTRAMIL